MKILLLIIFAAGVVTAQTVYKVTPGTKDNKIILTVENASSEADMTDIKAVLSKQISTVRFEQIEQTIEKIEKQNSKEVEFTFEVNRSVEVSKTDTLKFVISSQSGNWIKEILISYEIPKEFTLEQNYPNPFNPETMIGYQLASGVKVTLRIYDILGREIVTIVDEALEAGYYEKKFNAQNLSSGTYIYRLTCENVNLVKKMMVLK